MVAEQIKMPITSIYARRTIAFIAKREDILPNTVGQTYKKKLEQMGRKWPIWL